MKEIFLFGIRLCHFADKNNDDKKYSLAIDRRACVSPYGWGIFSFYYASTPPDFRKSRHHFYEQESAFLEIAALFHDEPEINRIALDGNAKVDVTVDDIGEAIKFSAEMVETIATQLSATAVIHVTRRNDRLEFFAGTESKLGHVFRVRVIRKIGLSDDLDDNKIASCSSLFIYTETSGECLDILSPNWGILYQWI